MLLMDYLTLKFVWWLFVCVLLIGFALLDGFDLGVGILLPLVGRTDNQRRVLLNAIGPTWEGNQVWFITAGGAIFAAWPVVYATAFSGLYWALLLVLFALFFRPVGFEYRSKLPDPRWRKAWDWGLFVGGAVPTLVFGVAFGNLLQGLPFHFDAFMRATYTGSFFALLNPFALLAGVVSLTMLMMHGAIYLQMRTTDIINQRARQAALLAGVVFLLAFAAAGFWQAGINGFRIETLAAAGGVMTPLMKTVSVSPGAWMDIYSAHRLTIVVPSAVFVGGLLALVLSRLHRPGAAFVCSGISVAGVIMTAALAMFPFVMPSSTHPSHSLTIFDAVSSHRTLALMFLAVVVFLPLVLAYTSWVYRVMRGKITEDQIEERPHSMY